MSSVSMNALQSLNSDAFLKLFVAQMRYQDPTQPMDTNQMMSELAQFTTVQKMTEMTASFASLLQAAQLGAARELLGQVVSYTSSDTGEAISGVASSAEVRDGVAGVVVGTDFVPVSEVTAIRPASSSA